MHRARIGWAVGLVLMLICSHRLVSAGEQPPEPPTLPTLEIQEGRTIDPRDPLLQSIQERMGKLPRLDQERSTEESAGSAKTAPSLKGSKRSKVSRKYRVAEWMLKSARFLEQEAMELDSQHPESKLQSEHLTSMAKELRKQVRVLLEHP